MFKKYVIATLLASSLLATQVSNLYAGWPHLTKDQAEYEQLMLHCLKIYKSYEEDDEECSTEMYLKIFVHLQAVRSNASFKVLKMLVNMNILPSKYLKIAADQNTLTVK